MKRTRLLIMIFLCFNVMLSHSQISFDVLAYNSNNSILNDTITICKGDTVNLKIANLVGLMVFYEDFNLGNYDSTKFTVNPAPLFNNPCPPLSLPAEGAVLWFGYGMAPRWVRTKEMPIDTNMRVEWDMKYGGNQNATNCETPDLPSEGVHLQWSIDNGHVWHNFPGVDIAPSGNFNSTGYVYGSGGYWTPFGGNVPMGPYYTWNRYSVLIPDSAVSNNTCFRWYQEVASPVNVYDHWGIDNIKIFSKALNTKLQYYWELFPNVTVDNISINPTQTQWVKAFVVDTSQNPPAVYSDSALVIVIQTPPAPAITLNNGILFSSSPSGNYWFYNGQLIPYANLNMYAPSASGIYQVAYTDINGCPSDTSLPYIFNGTGYVNNFENNKVTIVPNPTENSFLINSDIKIKNVEFVDINGKIIQSSFAIPENNIIDISYLNKGIYFVKITDISENKSIFKLVKN